MSNGLTISVVTSMYHSSKYLREFYGRCTAAIAPAGANVEFVFVDDGSPDDSLNTAQTLLESPCSIRIIQLARNYGAMRAMMVGMEYARGDYVFLLDCDLEEPPELFAALYSELQKQDADVAYALQRHRAGGFFVRHLGAFFYRIFNYLSDVKVPQNWMVCRVMSRRYVEALVSHREREIFFGGLAVLTGFKQVGVVGDKRHKGSTTYNVARKLTVTANALTSFSNRPLYLIFAAGMTVSAITALFGLYLLAHVMLAGRPYAPGWSSLLLAILFFGGMNLMAIGVVGLYLGRVLIEVKNRPCVIQTVFENYR